MSWIGLTDHENAWFCPQGLDQPRAAPSRIDLCPDALIVRGTLHVEIDLSSDKQCHELLGFEYSTPWPRRFSIEILPGELIALTLHLADVRIRKVLHWPDMTADDQIDTLHLTYAWDAPRRFGRFALQLPGTGQSIAVTMDAPPPFAASDLRALILRENNTWQSKSVTFAALSTQIEPLGPQPSLDPRTPIATPDGLRPIGQLQQGDVVVSSNTQVVPVLHRIDQVVPARGAFRPLRLLAPYFGLSQDILVAPNQRLVVRGHNVEYLFGHEAVFVCARHLMNNHACIPETPGLLVRYSQLILPRHEPIMAAGSWAESLYIGRLRRKPHELSLSRLAGVRPSLLPEHGKPALPVLRKFEAVTLADHRIA